MAESIFNIKFTPKTSSLVGEYTDRFDVVAEVIDPNGQYTANDVQVNDIVFLDTFISISSPYTVSKYIVLSIEEVISTDQIEVIIKYDDTGTIVDPGEVIDIPGFICRKSTGHGLSWVAATSTLGISDYVVEYARNSDMWSLVDKLGRVYWNAYTAAYIWTVNHNLGTKNVSVQCWNNDTTPAKIAPAKVEATTVNQVVIDWGTKETVAGTVCVIKSDI
jgi:hypothetical protein